MNIKSFFKNTIALGLVIGTLSSCDKEEIIPSTELPSEIQTYISTHFPNNPIIQSIKDRDGLKKSYDITLEGSFVLEFDNKNKITEIDGISKLPDSVIPQSLREYVTTNYPLNFITDWELDDNNQQIELDNTLELEFTISGEFLKIDN
ncbi:Protein of unknown function (DUF2874) [Bernardetia litoralis DSM 6794]|uniref:Putative beta-lactamase-inhibitor-like PepSY-like domain-containing protein n=1 Tax=Bernardetia litoralis (strain ATCC 23117 / DSM 6794 / NBRC 15988 / NCIMB 1366 / Fx l1 / Sio-4) TaxID=880071 RepID=I4AFR5_BERLS|nr:PepSY-like domain-containing protein [Bernardetia litoralis]AFM02800.1 Protein of unknown function (DUF2874) [Bernardetia litoralis DSM 6794]